MKKIAFILSMFITAAIGHTALAGTAPPMPLVDDNGDKAFVKQILPKLLGRKPKGMLEVNLLSDIIALHGREAVVRALMEQTEFNQVWTALIVDHLHAKRESTGAQLADCFNGPMFSQPAQLDQEVAVPQDGSELAAFVRDNGIGANYAGAFNFYDLLYSAIQLDNLLPAYRGYLFVLGSKPPGPSMRTEAERRQELGQEFNAIYLNRDLECMGCHNSTYSTTGIGDRTHPMYATMDLAIFDSFMGGMGGGNIAHGDYQASCAACHGADGQGASAPGVLGASAALIEDKLATVPVMQGIDLSGAQVEAISTALASGPFASAFIAETKAKHYAMFRTDFFAWEEPANGFGPWGMSTDCASVAGVPQQGAIPAFFAGLSSDYLSPYEIDTHLQQGYQSLPYTNLPAADASNSIPGEVAYAHTVAASIVENVWEQIMGEPLTIANQYSRNGSQMHLHKHLTEDVFIANDWSLKELIVAILQTRFFNRMAPIASNANGPYELQALFDPFVVSESCRVDYSRDDRPDREPIDDFQLVGNDDRGGAAGRFVPGELDYADPSADCRYNGVGDIVHRYSPYVLFESIGSALDWPSPKIFPNNSYPNRDLSAAIGQYLSAVDNGSKDVDFQALLNWDGTYGDCPQRGNDWIEKLIAAIDEFNAEHPEDPLTLAELVLTMKDWLIQEPIYGGYPKPQESGGRFQVFSKFVTKPPPGESKLIANLFGVDDLHKTTVSSDSVSENHLRQLCGVYLKSPQFMLAGIVRNDELATPRFRVCNDNNCSYQSMCNDIETDLDKLGFATDCRANSVSKPLFKVIPLATNKKQVCLDCLEKNENTSDEKTLAKRGR